MTALLWISFVGLVGLGCSDAKIEVTPERDDFNHHALQIAVDQFVAMGRTPDAYAQLARSIETLRPGMDGTVAAEAERYLVALALGPMIALRTQSAEVQRQSLALTVWPTLLGPKLGATERDRRAAELVPRADDDPAGYLARLCTSGLVEDCRHIEALAIRRATERARASVAACLTCTDPDWHEVVLAWEAMARGETTRFMATSR